MSEDVSDESSPELALLMLPTREHNYAIVPTSPSQIPTDLVQRLDISQSTALSACERHNLTLEQLEELASVREEACHENFGSPQFYKMVQMMQSGLSIEAVGKVYLTRNRLYSERRNGYLDSVSLNALANWYEAFDAAGEEVDPETVADTIREVYAHACEYGFLTRGITKQELVEQIAYAREVYGEFTPEVLGEFLSGKVDPRTNRPIEE